MSSLYRNTSEEAKDNTSGLLEDFPLDLLLLADLYKVLGPYAKAIETIRR
jgi:hypothetical protein